MRDFFLQRRQHIRSLALDVAGLRTVATWPPDEYYDFDIIDPDMEDDYIDPGVYKVPLFSRLLDTLAGGPLTSLELRLGTVKGGLGDWMFHLPHLQRLRLRCPPAAEYTRGTGCELRAAFSRLASLTHLSLRGFCDLTFDRGALPASLRELEVSDCWVKCTAGGGIVRDTFGRALAAAASRVQGLQSLRVGHMLMITMRRHRSWALATWPSASAASPTCPCGSLTACPALSPWAPSPFCGRWTLA